jgi:hypothetical protein
MSVESLREEGEVKRRGGSAVVNIIRGDYAILCFFLLSKQFGTLHARFGLFVSHFARLVRRTTKAILASRNLFGLDFHLVFPDFPTSFTARPLCAIILRYQPRILLLRPMRAITAKPHRLPPPTVPYPPSPFCFSHLRPMQHIYISSPIVAPTSRRNTRSLPQYPWDSNQAARKLAPALCSDPIFPTLLSAWRLHFADD